MQKKRTLLLVSRDQFGYHVGSYEYARVLREKYDITFFSWDYGLPRISLPGINTIYSSRTGNIIARNIRFRLHLLNTIRRGYDHIFIKYFLGVSLVHLVASQGRLICDIRTANVDTSLLRRLFFDAFMVSEVATFRHKTIISDGLAKRLFLKTYRVLPLGGNMVPALEKNFDDFKLIYVGTFDNRKLSDTVRGFKKFYDRFKHDLHCTYTIIGTGMQPEVDRVQKAIEECDLQDVVKLPGYIQHDALTKFFKESNIGISYVPITRFYDYQPPTKTYEYLLGGMAVLATRTLENQRLINDKNGVLIDDTINAVAEGLEELYKNRSTYRSASMQKRMEPFQWKNIALNNLHKYMNSIYKKNGHSTNTCI